MLWVKYIFKNVLFILVLKDFSGLPMYVENYFEPTL